MSESTTARLAAALREIPGMPPGMITRAASGHYDDYKSSLAFPLYQLVIDLSELAKRPATPLSSRPLLLDLAARVKHGDFDASKEEADEWARSPEGQEAFKALIEGK